jgi:hypothetical protein
MPGRADRKDFPLLADYAKPEPFFAAGKSPPGGL